jgi:hypothetical protein
MLLQLIPYFFLLNSFSIDNPQPIEPKENQLANYLKSTNYPELFFMGSYSAADSIWDSDTTGIILQTIVADEKADSRSRFFSAQILFSHSEWIPSGELKKEVAGLYASALRHNYTDVANPWGLPDDYGDAGKNVVKLGKDAIDAFRPLLHCKKRLVYIGSKTATVGKIYRYRVKDVAACYINAILNWKFVLEEKIPVRRRLTICRLKTKLLFTGK